MKLFVKGQTMGRQFHKVTYLEAMTAKALFVCVFEVMRN